MHWNSNNMQRPVELTLLMLALGLLVSWVCGRADTEYFIKYGPNRKTLMTVEGGKNWLPKIHKNNVKRFLTFNNDERKIRVDIEFEIPFLTIPIGGKTMEGTHGHVISPSVDVNVKALLVSSVLFFVFFFVIPKLVGVFLPSVLLHSKATEESYMDRMLRDVESTFNINSTACWQQGVCSMVKLASRERVQNEPFPSWSKIVDGLTSTSWAAAWLEGSSLGDAVFSAKSKNNGCDKFYNLCPVTSSKLSTFTKGLAMKYMNNLIQLYNSKRGKKEN